MQQFFQPSWCAQPGNPPCGPLAQTVIRSGKLPIQCKWALDLQDSRDLTAWLLVCLAVWSKLPPCHWATFPAFPTGRTCWVLSVCYQVDWGCCCGSLLSLSLSSDLAYLADSGGGVSLPLSSNCPCLAVEVAVLSSICLWLSSFGCGICPVEALFVLLWLHDRPLLAAVRPVFHCFSAAAKYKDTKIQK